MFNSVIHCVIDFYVKPEATDKVRSALIGLLEPARKDDGCLKYKLFENLNDQNQFTFIEVWESEDAFDDHLQTDHIRKIDDNIQNDLIQPIEIKRYKYLQTDPNKMGDAKPSSFCLLL